MRMFLLVLLLFFHISNSLHAQGPVYKIWNTSNSSIPSNSLYSIYIDNEGIIWIGSTNKGLIKFDGKNFTSFNMANSPMQGDYASSIAEDRFNNLWITAIKPGAGNHGALMKFDKVSNWSFYNTTNSGISNSNNMKVAIDSNNIVWVCWFKLSKFNGTSWVTYDSTNSPIKYSSLREIYVDKDNNKWIGVDDYGLYKLTNDTNWTYYSPLNSGLGGTNINKIKEDNSGNLWIAIGYYGLTKFNPFASQWQNWTPKNSGLISGHPWGMSVGKDNIKWIGYGNGGSLTSLLDTTFSYYTPAVQTYEMAEDKFGNLWIATAEGLFEFNKNGIVGINNESSIITNNFTLHQNYPNPFNPSTKINYELQITNYVTLNVYDINGRLVKEIVNQKQSAGNYSIDFDGSGLPSGTYVYRLQAGDFSETKKMVLLK